jgi:hypothetical protein
MGNPRLMQEPPDVEVLFRGDSVQVTVGPELRLTGWRGGLWVQYVTGPQDFTVEVSDGNATCGFILFQSENYELIPPWGTGPGSPDNYTGQQPRATFAPGVVTALSGGCRAYFKMFETVALNAGTRSGGPITYNLNDRLYVSENGYLCNDDPTELALVGITEPQAVGIVSAVPASRNGNRLGVDTRL